MSYDSDMARVIKRATDQGWQHRLTERNHHQFYAPDGHGIVHTSGTPSDVRTWNNFMADMKRKGYLPEGMNGATTSLGEVLEKVGISTAPPLSPSGSKTSARQIVRDHFMKRPEMTMSTTELEQAVSALRPDLAANTTSMALSNMASKGELVRVKMGWYRLPLPSDKAPPASSTPPNTQAPPPPDVVKVQPHILAPSDSTGDAAIDAELAELDGALTQVLDGFSTLERLLRRHKEAMKTLAKLKRLISGGEL